VADLEGAASAFAALLALPEAMSRIEAQQREILARLDALAGGAAIGPVDLTAAGRALGKAPSTLRRLAAVGRLPGALRVGRSWRVDLSAMRAAGSDDRIGSLAAEARSR
jgi:hypothetical protein